MIPEQVLRLEGAFATPAAYDDATKTQLGGVYTGEGRLVEAALRRGGVAWKHVDAARLNIDANAAAATLERAAYGGRYYAHFGHFVLETVPALYQAAPHASIIACHPHPAAWQSGWIEARFRGYFLHALGIAPERIYLIDQPTLFAHLIVPPLEAPPVMGVVGQNYITASAKIRDFALAAGPSAEGARIYLSRRMFTGGSHRVLENEAELEETFLRRGFSVVMPEQLPIDEQIRTVANASVVAGVDGSALHLCGFMRAGATVLIIETRPFRTQRAINRALGLRTLAAPATFVSKQDGVDVYATDIAAIDQRLAEEFAS